MVCRARVLVALAALCWAFRCCAFVTEDISPLVWHRQSFAGSISKSGSWKTRLRDFSRQDLGDGSPMQTNLRFQAAALGGLFLCGLFLARALTGNLCLPSIQAGLPTACVAGTGAGLFHSLSGPDHLAALAPLALRTSGPAKAFRTGIFWGFGHVLGQVLLGTSLLLLSQTSFLNANGLLHQFAEQCASLAVGVVLMIIGGMGVKESREWDESDDEYPDASSSGRIKTFATGILSGMHPDALLLCLPAMALPTRAAGIIFLASFGAGSILAMGGFTAALRAACKSLGPKAVRRTSMVASALALTLGLAICVSVAV